MRSRPKGTLIGLLIATVAGAGPRAPALPLRYVPPQLQCATFSETSRSDLETYVAGRSRRETLGLDGEWSFRASPAQGDSVRIEAWFDTLAVWRRSPEGSLAPETDALIGGRYRGLLSADGRYRAEARPFVPDEIAEVADVSRELDDLLPRLPLQALAPGMTWTDGAGLEIRRLGDSAGTDSILRFRLSLRRENHEGTLRGDSLPLRLRQTTQEVGSFAWHARAGLLRRERHITVETYVPIEPRVRRPVRSRVEQQVTLERLRAGCERQADR
jgi:hypothetical protein